MDLAESRRLLHFAATAERQLLANQQAAQRLAMMIAQATKKHSTTSELMIHARNEELITAVHSTIHTLRELSKTALRFHNNRREVTSDETA